MEAPATAHFNSTVTGGEVGPWTIAGWVDSENSQGVPLRYDYSCSATLNGDTFHYSLDSFGLYTPEPAVPSTVDQAKGVCYDAVRKELKAPATAQFTTEATGPANGPWVVTGSVDSQNGFGALIRAHLSCDVTFDGNTFHATLTRLN